jgi:hypothetical protein
MLHRVLQIPLFMLAAAIAGCGLFDTRLPENPVNSGSTFESPTSPSIVLHNIESALRNANASDYRRCFSDTSQGLPAFVFFPSTQGMAAAPSKFSDWTIKQEEQYVRTIFAELQEGNVCSVTFSPPEISAVPIADSLQFTASYSVHFPHTREGAERDALGSLQFTLRLSRQNEWYITYWRDFARDDKPSWSLIKARFADN